MRYNTPYGCETDCKDCAPDDAASNICADCVYRACIGALFLQPAARAADANPSNRRRNAYFRNPHAAATRRCSRLRNPHFRNARRAAAYRHTRRRNPRSSNAHNTATNPCSYSAATNHPTAYAYAYHSNSTAYNAACAYARAYCRPRLPASARRRPVHSDNRRQVSRLRTASRWNGAMLGTQRIWQPGNPRRNFTCGLRINGVIACWGENDIGQTSPPIGKLRRDSRRAQTRLRPRRWHSNPLGRGLPRRRRDYPRNTPAFSHSGRRGLHLRLNARRRYGVLE